MNSDDPQKILRSLQDVSVTLPHHRARLRKRLMAQAATLARNPSHRDKLLLRTRTMINSRKLVPLGLSVIAAFVIFMGLMLFSSNNGSNQKFIADSAPPSTLRPTVSDRVACESQEVCLPPAKPVNDQPPATPDLHVLSGTPSMAGPLQQSSRANPTQLASSPPPPAPIAINVPLPVPPGPRSEESPQGANTPQTPNVPFLTLNIAINVPIPIPIPLDTILGNGPKNEKLATQENRSLNSPLSLW